jgi:phosphatidylserine synthase
MRWNVGPFGLKDLFTLVNLLGGVAAIAFVAEGRMEAAGYALLAGYLLGDALDGPVARATKTSNQFGSEMDTATDHFVQAIVPAIIVHGVYTRGGHPTAGIVLMAIIIACATTRQALFSVAKLGDPLMYCGLPRTVSGYASMAFVLSPLFFRGDEAGFLTGEVLIPALALMNLLPIPYMTHRGARRMQWYVKVVSVLFLVTPVAAFFVARNHTFDILFFWLIGYALTAWIPLRPDERKRFFKRYREWAAEVSRP